MTSSDSHSKGSPGSSRPGGPVVWLAMDEHTMWNHVPDLWLHRQSYPLPPQPEQVGAEDNQRRSCSSEDGPQLWLGLEEEA